ncbi:TVP38/TMEM64 family protein [Thalassotalea euphylliae]|uniref:TVP38/TMEM64 family protein n=1 Tax=Thalassotalea euphylliae TaxID=1655234 RepID=UPI00363F5E25
MLALYLFLSVATALALPRQVAALSAGVILGFSQGLAIALLATITGCFTTYLVAKLLLANWVKRRFPDKTKVVHEFLSNDTFVKALIIRILPLGSNWLTNVVAGATRIPTLPFILGSSIGFVPQMVIFSLAGAGLKLSAGNEQIITYGLVAIAIALVVFLWCKKTKKKPSEC